MWCTQHLALLPRGACCVHITLLVLKVTYVQGLASRHRSNPNLEPAIRKHGSTCVAVKHIQTTSMIRRV